MKVKTTIATGLVGAIACLSIQAPLIADPPVPMDGASTANIRDQVCDTTTITGDKFSACSGKESGDHCEYILNSEGLGNCRDRQFRTCKKTYFNQNGKYYPGCKARLVLNYGDCGDTGGLGLNCYMNSGSGFATTFGDCGC